MLARETKSLTDSYLKFATKAKSIMHIESEEDYAQALEYIEYLFDEAEDSAADPLNDLITIVSNAIKNYEANDKELKQFERKVKALDSSISVLRVLMDQYQLSSSDLQDEIGSKSLVSMILSGQRSLTKDHIANLAHRFNISPALFF